MTGWVTVFDVASEPFRWGNAGEGLAALALVAGGTAVSVALRRRGRRGATAVMAAAFGVAAFFLAHTLDHRREHEACVEALRRGDGKLLEGRVEQFQPLTSVWQRPSRESFVVAGERVSYPLFADSCGYHRTVAEGGSLHPGERVRLRVWKDEILRLEIETDRPPAPPGRR